MRPVRALLILALAAIAFPARPARAADFTDEIERDIPLRALGKLHVTNARGSITIQGWSQDRIRIKARKKASAETEAEARKLFSAVDFRFGHIDGDIELSAEYGHGLQLADRVRERENRKTSMDIVVYAPANLPLRVWTIEGGATVRKWNAEVEARTSSGAIQIEEVKAVNVSLLCPSCALTAREVKASLRCIGGSGPIELSDIVGSETYVETDSGNVRVSHIQGDQLYVSKSGSIVGKELDGRIEFHSTDGAVSIHEGAGYLSGRTDSGDIVAKMRKWTFSDKALLESHRGNISLTVPGNFFGDVDIWSVSGKAQIGFPIDSGSNRQDPSAPALPNRFTGRVGKGGELLKIFSDRGNVQLLRGSAS